MHRRRGGAIGRGDEYSVNTGTRLVGVRNIPSIRDAIGWGEEYSVDAGACHLRQKQQEPRQPTAI
eukprot:8865045-Pyramimonas_sp.AAC.1